jgi:tRNA modification GTPase
MSLHPDDTIVALSTAVGPGARAIIRLSGSAAYAVARTVFTGSEAPPEPGNFLTGVIRLPGVHSPLPADLYYWHGPRSYTGQDVVELHTLSAGPLIDALIAECLSAGARAAQPGEFTMRAFLAGKLDLTRAEAVLGVIEAGNREELQVALTQLAGGVARPLEHLRDDLLNLLADLEAGLDFADEDIHFVGEDDLLHRLARALAILLTLKKQLEGRALDRKQFRAVLAGPPNAGKSSLFNVLVKRDAALVSPTPGTTRDYLEKTLKLGDIEVLLIDTAGLRETDAAIEAAALQVAHAQAEQADVVLWCEEANTCHENAPNMPLMRLIKVATKCDLAAGRPGWLATSAKLGMGLDPLKDELERRARARKSSGLAPSLSRCRHHVDACLTCLRRAHALVLDQAPPELLALDLREALDQVGAMVGAVFTDDLLDRIFSRFCIGK